MPITTKLPPAEIARRAVRYALGKPGQRQPQGGILTRLAAETGHAVTATVEALACPTAAWTFTAKGHAVKLADKFTDTIDAAFWAYPRARGADRAAWDYALQLLRHEAWHGRLSFRDVGDLHASCKTAGVEFDLFNVFEDARIEAAARKAEGDLFAWWRWNAPMQPTDVPLRLFHEFTREETCSSSKVRKRWTGTDEVYLLVADFWSRATQCATGAEVIALCVEWKAAVRDRNVPQGDKIPARHGGDVAGTYRDDYTPTSAPINADVLPGPAQFFAQGSTHKSMEQLGASFPAHAQRLAQRLSHVVAAAASPRSATLATSGPRLHLPAIAAGDDRAFRQPGQRLGTPRVTLVLDMSGSMWSDWILHGRVFTAAWLRLLRERRITGEVLLTGGGRHADLPMTTSDRQLATLQPNKQGESLRLTLERNATRMAASHATVVYTDGELYDGDIDAGKWRARGVELIGACVAGSTYAMKQRRDNLASQFRGKALVAANGQQLAQQLAQYLGTKLGGR